MIKKIVIYILTSLVIIPMMLVNDKMEHASNSLSFKDKVFVNLSNNIDASIDNINEISSDDLISVVLQYEPTHFLALESPEINSDIELMLLRNDLQSFYETANEIIFDKLELTNYTEVYLSTYGPFISFKYDGLPEFFEHDFRKVEDSDSDELLGVYVENVSYSDMATRNSSSYMSNYPFYEALSDIGVYGRPYHTGNGIKIGSIESGVPNNYVNLNGVTYETYGATQTDHAFTTSSIYAGNHGIATDAEIYFAALSNYSFLQSTDWLLSKGVNVINRSNGATTGAYTSTDAYTDYVVKETKVTFVNSAGNSYDNQSVGSPSVGLNVISVASNDYNLGISYFSSAGLTYPTSMKVSKPNVIAPGGRISDVPNVGRPLSGTSFSAPMVTGVVALLMEEFQDLKYNPEKVMNIITNSTNYVFGQTEEFDHDAGFGIIHYQKARKACQNTYKQVLTNSVSSNALVFSENVEIPFGYTIHAETFTMYNSTFATPSGSPDISSIAYSQFRIEIKNSRTNQVVSDYYVDGNFTHLTFSNGDLNQHSFTINVYLLGDKATTGLEHYSIGYFVYDDLLVSVMLWEESKVDIPPTFSWYPYYPGKFRKYDAYDFVFLNSQKKEIFRVSNINPVHHTLTIQQWQTIMATMGSNYYVYVVGYKIGSSTMKARIGNLDEFNKPSSFATKYIAYPSNYGLPAQYFFNTQSKEVTVGNLTFNMNMLRTGFIENEFINLSPRRSGAGTAYLEYVFTEKVYRIDVDLSLWGASESINANNATAVIQYKNSSGQWVTILDLLNDVTLSTNRYNQDTYSIVFPNGTYEYRYYMTADAIGSQNKGRLSIGNTVFYTKS